MSILTRSKTPHALRKVTRSCVSFAGFFLFAFLLLSNTEADSLFVRPQLSGQAIGAEGVAVPGYKRVRQARINPPMLAPASPLRMAAAVAADQPTFTLNLFGNKEFEVAVTKTVSKGSSRFVSYGKVIGFPESQVILSMNQGAISGSVFVPGQDTVQIFYAGNGLHTIAEIDPAAIPGCGAETVAIPGLAAPAAGDVPATAASVLTEVDVMVVYTAAARTGAGGTSGMQSLIELAVAEANEAYGNSAVDVQLNLVHMAEIAYTETGSAETDLTRLQASGDGYLEAVHTLRSQYGADVVILITETMSGSNAGLSFIMSPPSNAFENYAFAVVRRQYATGTYTFAHEVGHVFGCHHNRANASSEGAYSYSYGHHLDVSGTTYRTIMAYAPGTRIPYFSNPNVNYSGVATGIDENATNSANNALTINNTASIVADFTPSASLLNFEFTSTNLTETNITVTLTVLRTGDTTGSSTVLYSTTGITAAGGSDYTATNGTLSFSAGETNKTISVDLLNDSSVESSETLKIVLTNPTNCVVGPDGTAEITIDDDDIGISFLASTASIAESGTNVTLNVRRTGDTSGTVTIDYVTADVSAVDGSDYVSTNGTLSFGAGVTNLTITVDITDDADNETNETFKVNLSNPTGGATLVSPTNSVVTILEEDSILTLSTNALTLNENATSATLTVLRTGGTNYTISVDYLTIEDSATNAVDFTSTNASLSFGPGITSKTITIPILNDSAVDGDKAFSLVLTNASGASLGAYTNASITLMDNDSVFEFSTNAVVAAESSGSVSMTILRSGGVVAVATVRYATTNNIATAGTDYTAKSTVLSFAAGETSKTISIPITNDTNTETNEAFNVLLSSPTGEGQLGSVTNITVTINDNDSILTLETNAVTVAEGDGTATLNILRSGTLSGTNTVKYSIKPGTAGTTDYTPTNGVVTFSPNATNATITIPIADDALVEGTETFSVQLTSPTGGALISGTNIAYVTITENDAGLAFEYSSYNVDEGATNVVLTVVQTGNTNASPSIDYSMTDLGASDGSDYTAATGTLNFGPGTNSLTITIPIAEDSTLETNETFRVSLSNVSGGILLANTNALVKILENDTILSLSTNAVAFNENAGSATLTLLRTGGTNYSVTVDYLTVAGTGTNSVDFTSTNATLTLGPGITSKAIAVPLVNDSDVDGDKTVSLSITNAVGASLGSTTNATITLKDTDSAFEFSTNAVTVAETAANVSLTVVRSGGLAGAATVRYYTTNDTATAGTDYTTKSGLLSFAAGETNKTILIPVTNDTAVETNEIFNVTLHSPTGEGALGSASTVAVTISDNDSLLSLETNSVTVAEGDGTATLNILRTGTLTATNTLKYIIKSGTAGALDYTAANGTLTFLPSVTNATISIPITDDSIVESSESFSIQISSPTGGALISGTNVANITITENDVGLAFNAASYEVDEGGTNIVLTVLQTGNTNASPSVDYSMTDLSASDGLDYTATNGTFNFGPGTNSLSISIPILEDTDAETNETFRVSLSNVSGAILLVNSNAVVRILENDTVLTLSTNAISVAENAAVATLTVLRTGGTNYSVTVDYLTSAGTATNAVDFTSTNATLTLGPGVKSKSFTVPLLNDSDIDGDKTFSVSLTNSVGAVLGSTTNATVTISDNDSTFEFSTNAVTSAETIGSLSITVVRDGGLVGPSTVRYYTTNDTATAGSDYTAKSGLLSFAAGETNKTILLPITNDSVNETNETFEVVLHSPTAEAALGSVDTIAITISDNDSRLSFETNAVTVAEGDGTVTLNLLRSGTLTTTNTLKYIIKAGTAKIADYTSGSGTITFAPNATNATISIPITDDSVVESSETFSVQISGPTGGALISGTNVAYVTITENDAGLAFTQASYSVAENATNITLTVQQTGNLSASATVDFATSDLTATNAVDYTSASGTLSFGPGTNSLSITIPILDDSDLESNETFQVSLSNISGASLLVNSNAVVKILEDDSSLAFSTNVVSVIENAASVSLTVLRLGGTNFSATIDFLTADGTATDGDDYTSTNATLTFDPGISKKIITVPLSNDSDIEGDETFSLSLTNISGSILGTYTNLTVTVRDNDSVFSFTTAATSVAENAGTTVLSVRRTGGVAAAATVRFATTNGTASANSDFKGKSGTLKFAAGETNKTVSLVLINDLLADPDETFTIGLSSPTAEATLGTNVLTMTIVDNDFAVADVVTETGIQGFTIVGLDWDEKGCAILEVEGPLGASVIVESSADFVEWTPVVHGLIGQDLLRCLDGQSAGKSLNFYRVRQPEPTPDVDITEE